MRRVGVALVASWAMSWAIAWAAITVVVAVPAAPAGATPCASAAASSTSVAVVVDFGDGSPSSAVCVPADSSDNGAAVLAARARDLGTPAPRFDSSGFVCGIDGYPSSGCGDQNGSTYAYWSYWHGTADSEASAWDYSNVGPGGSRVHSNVVEGWRFQAAGAGNPSDPPPNGSPDPASTCAPPSTSTSVADTVPPASTETTTAVGMGSQPIESTSTSASAPATSTSVTSSSSTTTTVTSSPGTSSQTAAGSVRVSTPGSRASPWPAVATVGAIAGLGAAGVVVARRRRGQA